MFYFTYSHTFEKFVLLLFAAFPVRTSAYCVKVRMALVLNGFSCVPFFCIFNNHFIIIIIM